MDSGIDKHTFITKLCYYQNQNVMKSALYLKTLTILFAFCLTAHFTVFGQSKVAVSDVKLSVSKLMLGTRDASDSLATVNISKNIWTEFDLHGKEIGMATIIKNKDNEIHIKWISATNGAKKDGVTIYKITKEDTQYTFDIYFENKKQGYFIASSE